MHPQIKIVGEDPDGNIRAIAVTPEGEILTSGGIAQGGGGGDASAANQVEAISRLIGITEELGQKDDVIADYFSVTSVDPPATPFSINSLLKGLLVNLNDILTKNITTCESNVGSVLDYSGTIQNANVSFILVPQTCFINYLLIQNLVIPETPSNDLWINFNPAGTNYTPIGAGSIQIKPGETLELKGTSLFTKVYDYQITMLGEEVGQQYTAKAGSFLENNSAG